MGAAEIVDTEKEAAAQEHAPLIVREPPAAYLDAHGLGSGPIDAERVGEGHSNVTYLVQEVGEWLADHRPRVARGDDRARRLPARQRHGRPRPAVPSLPWYQALALWKAAVFMEGNYRRYLSGSTEDSYLGLFDEGVPKLAAEARALAGVR